MIELDVCVDRSGEVVVHHDTYLKKTGQLLSVRVLCVLMDGSMDGLEASNPTPTTTP